MRLSACAQGLLVSCAPVWLMSVGCSDYAVHEQEFVDVFRQEPPAAADVLLVIDDSHSMGPYQRQLGASFAAFLDWITLAEMEYRIGVTTTDVFASTAGVISAETIQPSTPDAEERFAELVAVGTEGSGAEMGLHAAWLALDEVGLGTGDGFLRTDAVLSVVFVSDEEDTSPWPVHEYVNAFRALKGSARGAVSVHAMVVQTPDDCPAEQAAESRAGMRYVAAAEQAGGVAVDLCREDFQTMVGDLSKEISQLSETFTLSRLPDAGSLIVELDGAEIPCEDGGWVYVQGERGGEPVAQILFDESSMPPLYSEIVVRYNQGSGDPAAFCGGAR